MIVDYIKNLGRYKGISSGLDLAIDYLLSDAWEDLSDRMELDGTNVYVMKQHPTLGPIESCKWESHFKYMDIHVAVKGKETLGYLNSADGLSWTDKREQNDCEFSEDQTAFQTVDVLPGMCVLLWPGEPHKPNTGVGEYTKLVVKIRVN